MIAIEHVAADHQKDETGKMSRCQEKLGQHEKKAGIRQGSPEETMGLIGP